mmetsp:Transcript_14024/g.27866  ORF Transcript_14024/g.27866 Transcript_14024/m.27866 type:complete len:275 (-) Transcript_14024:2463-3287(-)
MPLRLVNVYSCLEGLSVDQIVLPDVFLSPIRIDILKFVHQNMSKNKRQAYSVSSKAGTKSSARSWGTGRAVSRVPRVPGSGTHRSGQGAITNMCRGGRIFGPTTVWRKWHHKINQNQRRQALMTAIASSGLTSLIFARGHNIENIPEIPLVVESSVESHSNSKTGKKILEKLGVFKEVFKKKKKNKTAGKGKMRNRRLKKYRGPLLIFQKQAKCFRNIPGVETCFIGSLNVLKMAPGGHVGRFCIWTYDSFLNLNPLFSSRQNHLKTKKKKTSS